MSGKIGYAFSRILQKLMGPSAVRASSFGRHSTHGKSCQIVNTRVGNYSYINSNCAIVNARIGSFCSIASGVMIGGGSHPIDRVSSSPVFHAGRNACGRNFASIPFEPYADTVVGSDVWIGAHALIKGGVTIGDGAVIGMGSVVTHDVPPYAVVGGAPAKVLRMRFDEKTAAALLQTKWWDQSDEEIGRFAPYMDDPAKLIAYFENKNETSEES